MIGAYREAAELPAPRATKSAEENGLPDRLNLSDTFRVVSCWMCDKKPRQKQSA
jgi:hypothetical protein